MRRALDHALVTFIIIFAIAATLSLTTLVANLARKYITQRAIKIPVICLIWSLGLCGSTIMLGYLLKYLL